MGQKLKILELNMAKIQAYGIARRSSCGESILRMTRNKGFFETVSPVPSTMPKLTDTIEDLGRAMISVDGIKKKN